MSLSKTIDKKITPITIARSAIVSPPPVVTVLGHIDHGKTTLLDKIRESSVAARESGGITQHIGAYQVVVKEKSTGLLKKITFLDTPGHAAFSKMRSRGAAVADFAILVIAADESFKAQTKESLEHIKSAKIPFLVAINKVDLPNVNLEKVRKDLARNGVLVEQEGGDVVCLPISAKTGQGVDELLEMILLLAEMAELQANPNGEFQAVVIESRLDRAKGPIATLLVKQGTLKLGDRVKVESVDCKVRAMHDESGQAVTVAELGRPVIVLGFKAIPPVGGIVTVVSKIGEIAKEATSSRIQFKEGQRKDIGEIIKEESGKKLKIILKADTSGTLEAILGSLPENVLIIDCGVGDLTESDVFLADTTCSEMIGFRVKISSGVKKLAQTEKVNFRTFQTIYELLREIEDEILKIMEPTIQQQILGQAEIIAEFEFDKQRVAGCRGLDGKISKSEKLYLKRNREVIGSCRIKSMRIGKINVDSAGKNDEFGLILTPYLDFNIGDVLVSSRNQRTGIND